MAQAEVPADSYPDDTIWIDTDDESISESGNISPESIGAVPTSRTINEKSLIDDITLNASDIGAVAKTGDTMSGALTINANCTANWFKSTSMTDLGSAAAKFIVANSSNQFYYRTAAELRSDISALSTGGGTLTGALTARNIIPSTNATYNLGSNSTKWNKLYCVGVESSDYVRADSQFVTGEDDNSYWFQLSHQHMNWRSNSSSATENGMLFYHDNTAVGEFSFNKTGTTPAGFVFKISGTAKFQITPNGLIVGSSSYGSALPASGTTGQIFFLI